jgi:hypothetical protein
MQGATRAAWTFYRLAHFPAKDGASRIAINVIVTDGGARRHGARR